MINTDRDWEEFARKDAYYSVLTETRFAGIDNDPDARRQFFEAGEEHVTHLLEMLAGISSGKPEDWDVLDFGCGVGRLLIPFAQRCKNAFGVDVSATMLKEATRNIAEFACDNAAVGTMQDIPGGRKFDLLHSFIVFQHIPVEKGISLLRELTSHLKPNGRIALHFTFSRTYPHSKLGWKLASRFPFLIPYFRLLRGQNPLKPRMLMGRYDLNEVLHLLHEAGFRHCQIEIVNDNGNLGAMILGQLGGEIVVG